MAAEIQHGLCLHQALFGAALRLYMSQGFDCGLVNVIMSSSGNDVSVRSVIANNTPWLTCA